MKNLPPLLLALGYIMIACAGSTALAQEAHQPLFAAFNTYCVDANFDPAAEAAGVEIRGGKPRNPPSASTKFPWPMTVTNWDITVQGQKMVLNLGTSRAPLGLKYMVDETHCSITSSTIDEPSMDALGKWVGAPPVVSNADHLHYEFSADGAVRTPIHDENARKAALLKGNLWALDLLPKAGSLMLTHEGAIIPKPAVGTER